MFAPSISIKPCFFTTYVSWQDSTPAPRKIKSSWAMPISTISHGLVSEKANKRIKNAIDWLLFTVKEKEATNVKTNSQYLWRVNFITLTLCSKQIHSDNEIKKTLLNQFLTEIRAKYGCKNYVWRAESQSNGNIHFHVITDVFISWRNLRTDWNRIQAKLGYVDAFELKFKHRDPNSTDVHSVQKIKNLSAYLSKYCGKNAKGYTVLKSQANDHNPTFAPFINKSHVPPKKDAKFFRQIDGNLWGLSQQLSKMKSAVSVIDEELEEEVRFVQDNYPEKVKWFDFARVYLINFNQALEIGLKRIPQMLYDYTMQALNDVIQGPVKEVIPLFSVLPVKHKSKNVQLSCF